MISTNYARSEYTGEAEGYYSYLLGQYVCDGVEEI